MKKILLHAFLIFVCFLSVFPFIWMIISATNDSTDVIKGVMLPGSSLFENIENALAKTDVLRALTNSVIITVIGLIATVIVTSLAAFAFSLSKSKNVNKLFNILILSMMVPFMGQLVYLFVMFSQTGFSNTIIAAILPGVSSVYIMFFFKQSFDSYPREILESALIDGLSEFKMFYKIVVPSMKSVFAAVAIIIFFNSWNSYLWPLIILQDPSKYTLPMVAASLSSGYNPDYGALMIVLIISTIPSILIFAFLQRHFVQGIAGSVK